MSRMKSTRHVDDKMVRENPDAMAPASILSCKPPQWEYKSVLLSRGDDINGYGADRWELVSVIPQPADQAMFYFRRLLP